MEFLKRVFLILTLPIVLVPSSYAMKSEQIETLFNVACKQAAKMLSSDEEVEKFEKGESTCFYKNLKNLTSRVLIMEKEIVKIVFRDYIGNSIKSTMSKELAKELNWDGQVTGGGFSPDGKLVLTVSENGTSVWNVKTGASLYILNEAYGGEFSPDSKFILTVSSDGVASVRNSKTGELLYALDNALDDEFSPDSKLILIVSSDDVASVWNVKTGELLYALDNVWDSEFSPDSKFILTVSSDGVASVWNVKTGELLYRLDNA